MRRPVTQTEQLESEMWVVRLRFCGWWQLAALPGKVEGMPKLIKCHPFCFLYHKEEAIIKKRTATRTVK